MCGIVGVAGGCGPAVLSRPRREVVVDPDRGVPDRDAAARFVQSCFDEKSGGFSDRPGVTAPIVGARTAQQLRGARGPERATDEERGRDAVHKIPRAILDD